MGANKNENGKATDNKRTRAATARGRKREAQGKWDWLTTDWLYLAALTQAMAKEGGAVRIGVTRDGGAMALGMYHGEDYNTEYIKPTEDFRAAVIDIAEAWMDGGTAALEVELQTFQRQLKIDA